MTTFSGINNTSNLLDIGARALERRKQRDHEEAMKKTGGYIADGDMGKASSELLRGGYLKEGMALDDKNRERTREASRAGTIAEALGGMLGDGSTNGPGNGPASSQLQMKTPEGPSSGSVVQSEPLGEVGAASGKASTAIGNIPTPSGGLTTKQMMDQTGGDLSSGMLFSMASKFAKDGDVDMAEKYMDAANSRKEVEKEQKKTEEAKQAQYIFDLYVDSDAEGREALISQLLQHPEMQKSIPNEILSALTDRNPENDDAAVIAWSRMFGADPARLEASRDSDKERAQNLEDDATTRARDLADERRASEMAISEYRKKKEIDAEFDTEEGGGSDPYSPEYRNVPDSVKNSVYKEDVKVKDEASAETKRASLIYDKSKEFVSYVDQKNLWGAMGGGPVKDIQQTFLPSEMARLKGITNELVTEMKKPGAGVFTDDDARRAEFTVIGVNKNKESIMAMMHAAAFAKDRAADKEAFLDQFQIEGGIGSLPGAEVLWKQYTNENPILVVNDDNESVTLQEDVASFDEWYYGKVAEEDRRRFEAELDGLDPEDEQDMLNGYGE